MPARSVDHGAAMTIRSPASGPVLGIETSCDETGVALYEGKRGLLAHALYSQIAMHAEYGGVVPELASRDHIRRLLPLVQQVFDEAGITGSDVSAVAYTAGPGLIGALMVGASLAQGLATGWGVPVLPVHHMEGHLLAPLMAGNGDTPPVAPPFLALLVSGGHTQLIEVSDLGCYRLLGQTLDDAVGEAFDKTAKLLGLPYPGGPELARLAESGTPDRFRLPRPMTDRPGLDFSFSGLKTAVLQTLPADADLQTRADFALAFETAVAETFVIKCRRAIEQTGLRTLIVAGGVGANRRLRAALGDMAADMDVRLDFPPAEFCTDNGAMIAHVGWLRRHQGQTAPCTIECRARWPLDELAAV